MSYEERVDMITMVAGFDASAETNIGLFVVTGTDGKAEVGGANARATGVLSSQAPENHGVRVVIGGITPVRVGPGGLVAGAFVQVGAGGKAITQTSTNPRMGIVQASPTGEQVAFVENELAPMLFSPQA